jgi:hypothetical protein
MFPYYTISPKVITTDNITSNYCTGKSSFLLFLTANHRLLGYINVEN